jgi:uncharacterized protein
MTYIKTHPPSASAGRSTRRLVLATMCGLAIGPAMAQDGPQPRLPTVVLTAGMHRITAEVAQAPYEQAAGLMFRRQMGANDGMLFVYDRPHTLCFWMRNTPLPLTIAFIDDEGRIVETADMQPFDDRTRHCSSTELRFALEMHQGWFAKRGLKPGFRLKGPPFQP